MSLKSLSLFPGIGAVVLAVALVPSAFGGAIPAQLANKTFSVNVISSFGTSFTDCFRFSDTTLAVDGCGDSGPYSEETYLGLQKVYKWVGNVPCTGLNINWFGTFAEGSALVTGAADMIGASAIGTTEGTTFSINGIANANCPNMAGRNGSNWRKTQ